MEVRKIFVSALIGAMALVVPASSALAGGGGGGGLLGGGVLGGDLLGNGCNEDEIVTVGGDAGLVGVNLQGDIDTDHGVLGFGDKGGEDELVSVGGDAGLVGLLGGLDTDQGLVGINLLEEC